MSFLEQDRQVNFDAKLEGMQTTFELQRHTSGMKEKLILENLKTLENIWKVFWGNDQVAILEFVQRLPCHTYFIGLFNDAIGMFQILDLHFFKGIHVHPYQSVAIHFDEIGRKIVQNASIGIIAVIDFYRGKNAGESRRGHDHPDQFTTMEDFQRTVQNIGRRDIERCFECPEIIYRQVFGKTVMEFFGIYKARFAPGIFIDAE